MEFFLKTASQPLTHLGKYMDTTMSDLETSQEFIRRHIGPSLQETQEMLAELKLTSLDELIDRAVPQSIRKKEALKIPTSLSESDALLKLKKIMSQNKVFKSYLGEGYYGTHTPNVILRNVLENPSWYTQYTPYQAEISQGRLEALLNFQTLITELTGLPIANASLLDEATACAEAMSFCYGSVTGKNRNTFYVDENCHPQNIRVVQTRAKPLGIHIQVGSLKNLKLTEDIFGVLVQYPNTLGEINDYKKLSDDVHANKSMLCAACDLLSLTILQPPSAWGCDVAVGSTQRFGVPMGFGGPHAAFFATKDELKRKIPGRIVGVSKDRLGKNAIRLALQTREQHIRRDKATSNICTAQALPAILATFYAIYHGPEGLKKIAKRIQTLTSFTAQTLKTFGHKVLNQNFFDTLHIELNGIDSQNLSQKLSLQEINVRVLDNKTVTISLDETTRILDLELLLSSFNFQKKSFDYQKELSLHKLQAPLPFLRQDNFLKQNVFHDYHSETEMLRYMKRLQDKDLSLTHSMIPLGSCTMKLNATSEMIPISWNEISNMHPFAPKEQTKGYEQFLKEFESWLAEISGFDAVSLQPNAGSQGEYAGLLTIREYFEAQGQSHRDICLIPVSAHGTNPASSVMAGLKVIGVACDENGNIDVQDLKNKAEQYKENLACIMVTYPSTHGVFEGTIQEICKIIHQNGGQVYLDGANMNALVGLSSPGFIGADVCHMNLHKTFCIPHGGGGPGVGPIGVKKHLAPYLPGTDKKDKKYFVSQAPWGSASVLPISWMYVQMMGPEGLLKSTQIAILNANYIASRLNAYYPILYRGQNGFVAHECILDLRAIKDETGITVEDVAKRLMDYGFHAPTMSWPVVGTLMVEPTESESKAELDRFCDAMISIYHEIEDVKSGKLDKLNNPLKNAPHTALEVTSHTWDKPYSRELAAFPSAWTKISKFWPAVSRVDNALGDKNLICTCDNFFE